MKKVICKFIFISITSFMMFALSADKSTDTEKPKSLLQQLVDSYLDSSATNTILKHLLDAKMYLSTAEHDLLVSRDKESAQVHIENSLNYLVEAEKIAQPEIREGIVSLIDNLKKLERKTKSSENVGKDSDTDKLIAIAITNLDNAKETASPSVKTKIDEISSMITALQKEIEHANLREDYEVSMRSLNKIISSLK